MDNDDHNLDRRDVSKEDIHWDPDLSYDGYLSLDKLLSSQNRRTDSHDEMLFIIIHQASELWMKLCIHEIIGAMREVEKDNLGTAFKMLSRVSRIQGQLRQSWAVLSTMTPSDYLGFRDEVHRGNPERYERLKAVLNAPSFYDLCLQHLARQGFDIPADRLDRDWSQAYVPCKEVESAWAQAYDSAGEHWQQYELAEKLVDLEHEFQMWRFSHMKTVERIIGYRKGTGGTSGVAFLEKALSLRFFPELWTVRSELKGS